LSEISKGPWTLRTHYGLVAFAPANVIASEDGHDIAFVPLFELIDGKESANSKAIAAVPAMLAALEEIAALYVPYHDLGLAVAIAATALEKVKGG
jgi:hypothetical protein